MPRLEPRPGIAHYKIPGRAIGVPSASLDVNRLRAFRCVSEERPGYLLAAGIASPKFIDPPPSLT